MSLPDETASRAIVAKEFADLFARSERAHNALVEMITGGKLVISKPIGSNRAVSTLIASMVAKACKTFRATMITCEAGLGQDAAVLARQLFETTVAIDFILDKDIVTRTAMYAAYEDQRHLVLLEKAAEVKGLERIGAPENIAAAKAKVEAWAKHLDPPTLKSVRRHWSGKSLEWAAATVNLETAYAMMYRHTSTYAHGSDANAHFFIKPGTDTPVLKLSPGTDLIEPVLYSSITLLLVIAHAANEAFGLGQQAIVDRIAAEKPQNAER